jgi:hypothetical protein
VASIPKGTNSYTARYAATANYAASYSYRGGFDDRVQVDQAVEVLIYLGAVLGVAIGQLAQTACFVGLASTP